MVHNVKITDFYYLHENILNKYTNCYFKYEVTYATFTFERDNNIFMQVKSLATANICIFLLINMLLLKHFRF